MPSTSSLLSVVVLVSTLLATVAFAFVSQNIRYLYLQQLGNKIARTQEVVSAGAWYTDTLVVVSVKNIGGRGILVKTLKLTINYVVVYKDGEAFTRGFNKIYNNIYLAPFKEKVIAFDIMDEIIIEAPSLVEKVYVNYLAMIVSTEKNVFIFDPLPPLDSVVLIIDKDDIGETLTVTLPNGKVVEFTVYEYLMCSIGELHRHTTYLPLLESTKVYIAKSPEDEDIEEISIDYGYDYNDEEFTSADIYIYEDSFKLRNSNTWIELTVCNVETNNIPLNSKVITLSRGIILVGTHLSGYDIVVFSFARNKYPRYYSPDELENAVSGELDIHDDRSVHHITKIPLPDNDISVLNFLGSQIIPWVSHNANFSTIDINNYYSQAIILGQSYIAELTGEGDSSYIYVRFDDPYPILLVISPLQLSVKQS